MFNEHRMIFNNRESYPLNAYVKDAKAIWSHRFGVRSTEDVWLHVVNRASKLGEATRKFDHSEIREQLAHFLIWIFTFIGKLETNASSACNPQDRLMTIGETTLDDIIWHKYPGLCPCCYSHFKKQLKKGRDKRSKCICILDPLGIESRTDSLSASGKEVLEDEQRGELLKYAMANEKYKPIDMEQWYKMFEYIFGNKLIVLHFDSIMFHLLEEIGEVSDAILRLYTYYTERKEEATLEEIQKRRLVLKNEIADVLSWTFAVVVKYRQLCRMWSEAGKEKLMTTEEWTTGQWKYITIPNLIWQFYHDERGNHLWCPICRKSVCECKIEFLTTTEKVNSVLGK